jgi:hypothetical protein
MQGGPGSNPNPLREESVSTRGCVGEIRRLTEFKTPLGPAVAKEREPEAAG